MESGQAINDEAIPSVVNGPPMEAPAREAGVSCEPKAAGTRRDFLGRSAKKLAYISPVVLLLRPRPACASRIYS